MTIAQAIRILGGERAEALAMREAARQAEELRRLQAEWRLVRRPVTLRDARRVFTRSKDRYFLRYGGWRRSDPAARLRQVLTAAIAVHGGQWLPVECAARGGLPTPIDEIARLMDRLIAVYGPGYDISAWLDRALSGPLAEEAVERAITAALSASAAGRHSEHAAQPDIERAVEELAQRPPADRTDHQIGSDRLSEGPHNSPDADTHGGDGNSGECDAPAQTAAEGRQGGGQGHDLDQGPDDGPSQGLASGVDGSPSAGRPSDAREGDAALEAEQPTGQGPETGADEATDQNPGMGSRSGPAPARADARPDGNRSSADSSESGDECGSGNPVSSGVRRASDKSEAHAAREAETPRGFGGRFLSSATDPIRAAQQQARAAREAALLLERVISRAVGADGRFSPRVDARALVRELVSRRAAIHRARRREWQIRHLVIAVDESESCSRTVAAVYHLALAVARSLPTGCASVVIHSNGYALRPGEICAPTVHRVLDRHSRGLAADYFSTRHHEAATSAWLEIVESVDIGLVLHLGDDDAHWIMSDLVRRGIRVISLEWLSRLPAHEPWRVGPVYDSMSAAVALRRYVRRVGT